MGQLSLIVLVVCCGLFGVESELVVGGVVGVMEMIMIMIMIKGGQFMGFVWYYFMYNLFMFVL